MEAKKSKSADLRNMRTLFFEIGMVVAIGLVLAAFQFHTEDSNNLILTNNLPEYIPDEFMQITRMEQPKPPEPPKAEAVKKFEQVDNTSDVEDPGPVFNPDDDPTVGVVIIPIPEEAPVEDDASKIFFIVEEMPVYPGGNNGLMKDIMSRVVYPEIAKENGIKGRVFVQFVVNAKGEVEKVQVARGVDPSLDNEAMRVIKSLKGWTPGKQRGKAVSVSFTVPINFQLN